MDNFSTVVLQEPNDIKTILEREIVRDIEIVQVVAADIETQNELIETCNDPELQVMYSQNMLHSIDIYNTLSKDIYIKLGEFFDCCKKDNLPVNINYYRIYKVLKSDYRNNMKSSSV